MVKKILVVDDDAAICSFLREGLLLFGYDCQTASNGFSALEHISKVSPDIMVTDIIMPGMDGIELTMQAKKLRTEMSIILMTGFNQEESYERAIAIGAADFIKKPFAIDELLIRIERVSRDALVLSEIIERQQEIRDISREMIAGMQDEAMKKISQLEEEIISLRKNMK